MRVLAGFTPDLEIYSIDEAFLGLAGFEQRLEAHARELRAHRAAMDRHSGLGRHRADQDARQGRRTAWRRKTRPRAASRLLLDEPAQEAALAGMELTDLWGIAGRLARAACRRSASRRRSICATPIRASSASASASCIERMVHRTARHRPASGSKRSRPIARASWPRAPSAGRSTHARRDGGGGRGLHGARGREDAPAEPGDGKPAASSSRPTAFKPSDAQHCASQAVQLPVATADTGKLIAPRCAASRRSGKPGYRYKKAGVMFLDLRAGDGGAGRRCSISPTRPRGSG